MVSASNTLWFPSGNGPVPELMTGSEAKAFRNLRRFIERKGAHAGASLGLFLHDGELFATGTVLQKTLSLLLDLFQSVVWKQQFELTVHYRRLHSHAVTQTLCHSRKTLELFMSRVIVSRQLDPSSSAALALRHHLRSYDALLFQARRLDIHWQGRLLHRMGYALFQGAERTRPVLVDASTSPMEIESPATPLSVTEESAEIRRTGSSSDSSSGSSTPQSEGSVSLYGSCESWPLETFELQEEPLQIASMETPDSPPSLQYHPFWLEGVDLFSTRLTQNSGLLPCDSVRMELAGHFKSAEQFQLQATLLQLGFNLLTQEHFYQIGVQCKRLFAQAALLYSKNQSDYVAVEARFDALLDYLIRQPETAAADFESLGQKADFYEIVIDLLLLRTLKEALQPHAIMKAALLLPVRMRSACIATAVPTLLSALSMGVRADNNELVAKILDVARQVLPALTVGYWGPPGPLKEACHSAFKRMSEYYRALFACDFRWPGIDPAEGLFKLTMICLHDCIQILQNDNG